MTLLTTYAIIALAAFIHASFQLSVSTFTLMSGHHFGKARSHRTLNQLIGGFLLGTVTMTILLLCTFSLAVMGLAHVTTPHIIWSIACGLCFGVGAAVWMFYYPRGSKGTTLWLPRKSAEYLAERSKKTENGGEAFGLGLASVFAELAFVSAPLLVAATVLIPHTPLEQLTGIAIYVFISMLSLLVVTALVGSGHKISRVQEWREKNKTFLQFVSGSALLVLGFVIYVDQVYSAIQGVSS